MRFHLGSYLKEHGITAYRLAQEVGGKVAPNTVYSLARRPAQRIDLDTVSELLQALERVRGTKVSLTDLIQDVEPAAPVVLTQASEPAYSPETAKKFKFSGQTFRMRPGGPSAEQIIAEDRGRSYP